MEKSIKDHLQDIFDDLGAAGQKRFKSKLLDRKTEPRVRRAATEKADDSIDLADLMVNTFTKTDAVPVTIEILRAINCNDLASDLIQNTGQSAPQVLSPVPVLGPGAVPSNVPSARSGAAYADKFIEDNRTKLIERVNNVDAVLDKLLQMKILTDSSYNDILSERTPQSQMRKLFNGPIRSAGAKGRQALYNVLKEIEIYLIDDLEGN